MMNKFNYLPIIGIEVHIELKTKSKMFCGCDANHFGIAPNTHTCPTCLGLPGALPVPNKKAIEWCILIGLALNCEINNESKFDRKNYFYPDLPKGYQISQYDMPFCQKGYIEIPHNVISNEVPFRGTKLRNLGGEATDNNLHIARSLAYARDDNKVARDDTKIIKITRVHIEEDTAKLIHDKTDATLIDFNRSGVALVEIVTEPDINSSDEAVIYLKKIQQVIRYLGVSDCDMEKGSMRCEINLSLISQDQRSKIDDLRLPNYKVEVKNINSFKFVKKAIEYEIKRQTELLNAGKTPTQETRGFSEAKGITISQRSKEEAHDYRYFPEPDIPPFINLKSQIPNLKAQLPELPDQKYERFIKEYGLTDQYIKILTDDKKTADYFEKAVKNYKLLVKPIANFIINQKVDMAKIDPQEIGKMINQKKNSTISDQTYITKIVKEILRQNSQAVTEYKKGKIQVLGFLVGQVMRLSGGKAEAQIVRNILLERLTKDY